MKTSFGQSGGWLGKVLAMLLAVPLVLSAEEPSWANRKTLVVNGSGEVAAAPDQAIVRLGVSFQADKAAVAQTKVNEVMQAALAAIEKLNVPKKSIRSSNLNLNPVYGTRTPNEARVIAYRAANTIEVTVTDLKLVGKVIDAGLTAGANELQGVYFNLKNDDNQRLQALSAAAEEARVKANAIAKSLGITLAGIVEVTEGGVQTYAPHMSAGMGRMMMAKAEVATPVEPGEVRVSASVTVRYEIAQK